jgi:hypothetical protein
MNWVALSASIGAGDDSIEVTARGSATLWDPMAGIPTPPERGCGWLSYVGVDCSYDGHREDSHLMCKGSWNYTCTGYA